jgi:tetratricopeptide (TPR) repeat protein
MVGQFEPTACVSQNWSEACKYYSTALEHNAKSVEAWIGKGISTLIPIFGKANNYNVAKQCFDKALALADGKEKVKIDIIDRIIKNVKIKYPFGDIYQLCTLTPRELTLIYEIDENNVIGLIAKGHELRVDSSISFYKKALEISGNDRKVVDAINSFIRDRSSTLAFDIGNRFIAQNPALIEFEHTLKPNEKK